MLTASIEILRKAMWMLERDLKTSDNMMTYEGLRPLFSPSCTHLLTLLNVLRRGCDVPKRSLSDSELMTEKSGSLLGSILRERSALLKDCYATCRCMRMDKTKGVLDSSRIGRKLLTSYDNGVFDHREDVNEFETKAFTYQVLINVYKYLSVDVHHWKGVYCPTCHPTHLIKQELQTMIESVREANPLGMEGVRLSTNDPVNIEPIELASRIKFLEREKENVDLIDEFRKHSEVGKMINDCDLVAQGFREYPKREKKIVQRSGASNEMNDLLTIHMRDFSRVSQAGHVGMRSVREQLNRELIEDREDSIEAQAREDSFFCPDVGYYPYKLSFWSDVECCKIASTFTSMRDDVRYQGCDRAGTYGRLNLMGSSAVQRSLQRTERMNRYHPIPANLVRRRIVRPVRRRLFNGDEDDEEEGIVWREQRDSIRVDFACALRDDKVTTKDRAWFNVFGKYWIGLEDWCKSDVDQMHWLMMGANHMTVDTCGENMGAYVIGSRNINDIQCPSVGTASRALRRELGMQLPIRSRCKVRRDIIKYAECNDLRDAREGFNHTEEQATYWKCSGYVDEGCANAGCNEILLPNSKDCFFDECIIQPFRPFTVYPTRLFGLSHHFHDVYEREGRATYQQLQMDVSGELKTFAVGAPRFSSNGTLTNFDGGDFVMRDCRHVSLSPLFRYHYELPTNPNTEWIDQDVVNRLNDEWRPDRGLDVFQDPNEYGYVASQLTHLPRMLGYDFGNILSYDDTNEDRLNNSMEATYLRSLFREVFIPFNQRSNAVALQQCKILRDDSMYVINRRSLIVNKCQVFYNDDSSSIYSAALATNALKWSESVLGDCSQVFSMGQLSEPTRTIALKVDKPKLCIFRGKKKRNPKFFHDYPLRTSTGDFAWGPKLRGLEKFCVDNLSVTKLPNGNACESQDYLQESVFSRYRAGLVSWNGALQQLWKTPGTGQLTTSANRRLWLRGIVGRGCFRQLESYERQREDQDLRLYGAFLYGGLSGSGEVTRASLRGE